MAQEYLNIKDASDYLGVSTQTLRRWDMDGKLKSVRNLANSYRQYKKSDLEKFRPEYQEASESASASFDFFLNTPFLIDRNESLRDPQREAHRITKEHFAEKNDPCILQIPVGCGKTGVIAILPFGIAKGRVLVITPNVTIRKGVCEALDIANSKCFWAVANVLTPTEDGPFFALLDGEDANLHDCNESHFVVSNIQQLASSADRWLPQFPPDYFDMIIVDEGHHNVAPSWQKVFDRFPNAKVISLTATPFRGDQRRLSGEVIYRYPFAQAMVRGYIKQIHSFNCKPSEIYFTYKGDKRRHTLKEVMELKEELWFQKGVALSPECNKHIAEQSIGILSDLRKKTGYPHQIVAVACSIDHATQVAEIYKALGLKAKTIHSKMGEDEQEEILSDLKNGRIDCIVQVQMLGEGFDHPALSVAAVFRPFRSLSPYIQFIGRIMRVIHQNQAGHPDNNGFVVSHIGLNNDEHWQDFQELDVSDQMIIKEWLKMNPQEDAGENSEGGPRRFDIGMFVQNEIIDSFIKRSYLDPSNDKLLEKLLDQSSGVMGITLRQMGVDKEKLKEVLEKQNRPQEIQTYKPIPMSPQKKRVLTKARLYQRGKSVANRVISDLGLALTGWELSKIDKSMAGRPNFTAMQALMQKEINNALGVEAGNRKEASGAKLTEVFDALDSIGDGLVKKYSDAIKKGKSNAKN